MTDIVEKDLADLRLSVQLEAEADLHAANCDLHRANPLLKESNAIRARIFGHKEVNLLREQTQKAIRNLGKVG